jgi:hypothetical protein
MNWHLTKALIKRRIGIQIALRVWSHEDTAARWCRSVPDSCRLALNGSMIDLIGISDRSLQGLGNDVRCREAIDL